MYTRADFGRELKEKVAQRQDKVEIGVWAHTMYMEHIVDIDLKFREILLILNSMEMGSEFHLSYKRLDEIADDLIAGKEEVNMDY
jgi:hypothetical protein